MADPIEQYFMNAVRLQALIHTGQDIDTDKPPELKGHYGEMCRDPKICAGKGYCPRDPNCAD